MKNDKMLLLVLMIMASVCIITGVMAALFLPIYCAPLFIVIASIVYFAIHTVPGLTKSGAGAMNYIPFIVGPTIAAISMFITKVILMLGH